jgi:hypothetical protein
MKLHCWKHTSDDVGGKSMFEFQEKKFIVQEV